MNYKGLKRRALLASFILLQIGCSKSEHSSRQQGNEESNGRVKKSSISLVKNSSKNRGENLSGLKVKSVSGKAFVIEDFGSAPSGNARDVVKGLEALSEQGDAKASYSIYLKIKGCADLVATSGKSQGSNSSTPEQCKDLDPDYYAAAADWLKLAADQGSIGAQLLYGVDPAVVIGDASNMLRNPTKLRNIKFRL